MSKQLRPSFVEIDLSALKKNYQVFAQSSLGKQFMCPMVKANAYGHGDLKIVRALEKYGCRTFGVGLVEEGLHLREQGQSRSEILVFGFSGAQAVKELLAHNLTPVVSDFAQLEEIEKQAASPIDVHLKFNTGMNRLGFISQDSASLFTKIAQSKKIKIKGVATHLMTAEDLNDEQGSAYAQLTVFEKLMATHHMPSLLVHAYNSSGAARALADRKISSRFPYGLRTGLGIYGLLACDSDLGRSLYPVMSLKSTIVAVQKVSKGKAVSYGGTWVAQQDSVIGIVPIGYADGIATQLSNQGTVMIDNKPYPIAGRVCMDYTLVDVTKLANPLMQKVEFFGAQQTALQVSQQASTICYDILTRISERVPRVFTGEEI